MNISYHWIWIGLTVLSLFIIIIGTPIINGLNEDEEGGKEKTPNIKQTCRPSTISNPMGNLLPFDPTPELKACNDPDNVRVNKLFHGFLREQDDDINREKINPFLTLPVTNIIGSKTEFAEFLKHDLGYQCKSDGVNCEKYRDVRFSF